jgi:hypothetical protein
VSNPLLWKPPTALSLDEVLQLDRQVASMPDLSTRIREDIFRIRELEMDWDIGVMVYEPENTNRILIGPTGKKSRSFYFTAAFQISNPSNASRAFCQTNLQSKWLA